jgi:hypothetical protein
MIWIKVYTTQGEILLAACDEKVLGKTFEEGELQIEDFKKHLKVATIANLVGMEVIKIALELGMVSEESVIEIQGVPHAQIARMI